jgi:hypothetical protein
MEDGSTEPRAALLFPKGPTDFLTLPETAVLCCGACGFGIIYSHLY